MTNRAAGRQVARRMRDQSRGAGDRQCAGRRHRRALRRPAAHAGPHLRQAGIRARKDGQHRHPDQRDVRARIEEFAHWQGETSDVVASLPGFVEQRLMPPNPPLQVDWVILQRFASRGAAVSLAALRRAPAFGGRSAANAGGTATTSISLRDSEAGVPPSPVSAVISTRVKPGRKTPIAPGAASIAAAQSKAPGLQGYRFEPPVPGVQEDWRRHLAFRFGGEPAGLARLARAQKAARRSRKPFTDEFHARIVRTGFEQWFRDVPVPRRRRSGRWT